VSLNSRRASEEEEADLDGEAEEEEKDHERRVVGCHLK